MRNKTKSDGSAETSRKVARGLLNGKIGGALFIQSFSARFAPLFSWSVRKTVSYAGCSCTSYDNDRSQIWKTQSCLCFMSKALMRGRKGVSRAQFTAIKKRKSRNTIINFRVSRFTENKLTHEKDLSPYPIYVILLTVVLMYFRKRSTRDCVVVGNVRFGFTALLCSRRAVA